MLSVPHSAPHSSTFLPPLPSARFCYPCFSAAVDRVQYYEGSDSCRSLARPAGISAYSALPSGHPDPHHVVCPHVAFPHHSRAYGAVRRLRDFPLAAAPRLRHSIAGSPLSPRRNGFVILRAARSLPVA